MKKLISILLVMTMILSCLALASCSVKDLFIDMIESLEKLPEGIVKTKVTLENGEKIYISHSENFTQDDIDFVVMLYKEQKRLELLYLPAYYGLWHALSSAIDSNNPIYLIDFKTESPYYLAAYFDPEKDDTYYDDINKYYWYKFDAAKDVTMTNLYRAYIIYDTVVKRDIVNGIEYNQNKKCYIKYNFKDFSIIPENMFLSYNHWCEMDDNPKYFPFTFNSDYFADVYIDENGTEYLALLGERYLVSEVDGEKVMTLDYDHAKTAYNDFYDILSPYFTYFPEMDEEYTSSSSGKKIYNRYVYMEIDKIVELLFGDKGE